MAILIPRKAIDALVVRNSGALVLNDSAPNIANKINNACFMSKEI